MLENHELPSMNHVHSMQHNSSKFNRTDDVAESGGAPKSDLSPWPVRLLVYVILVVVALLAIRVIDSHAMSKQGQAPRPAPSGGP